MLLFTLLTVSRSVFSITLCGGLRGSCHLFFAFSSTDCRINHEKYCTIQLELTIVFCCIVVCFVVSSVLYTPSRKNTVKCILWSGFHLIVLQVQQFTLSCMFQNMPVFSFSRLSKVVQSLCVPFAPAFSICFAFHSYMKYCFCTIQFVLYVKENEHVE